MCTGVDHTALNALSRAIEKQDRNFYALPFIIEGSQEHINMLQTEVLYMNRIGPLLRAVETKDLRALELLLDVDGINANLQDYAGYTPLERAYQKRNNRVAFVLARHDKVEITGSSINIACNHYMIPSTIAFLQKQYKGKMITKWDMEGSLRYFRSRDLSYEGFICLITCVARRPIFRSSDRTKFPSSEFSAMLRAERAFAVTLTY